MPKICYVRKEFGGKRRDAIKKANEIIESYKLQGYELTLRQLYYQFVSLGFIDNNQKEYKNLGETINDARLAGYVDWDAIVDRTRALRGITHYDSPGQRIRLASYSYNINKWQTQSYKPEVWIEKDALVGVIERVCSENDVDFFSCRGYTSQSELWGAAMRLKDYSEAGQTPYIFHLGDHDPSGKDMTRDIEDRFEMFCGFKVKVKRLALNMDQVTQYNPPPNPAKLSDSRAEGYIREFGEDSWELDALKPNVIHELVEKNLHSIRDDELWRVALAKEKVEQDLLKKAAEWWDKIVVFINSDQTPPPESAAAAIPAVEPAPKEEPKKVVKLKPKKAKKKKAKKKKNRKK